MITDFKLISTEVESNFKVYYHFPAGNDNELTVPRLSSIYKKSNVIIDWSLSSLINLFDYHQRVPTQIDRFKLLKSVVLSACASVNRSVILVI